MKSSRFLVLVLTGLLAAGCAAPLAAPTGGIARVAVPVKVKAASVKAADRSLKQASTIVAPLTAADITSIVVDLVDEAEPGTSLGAITLLQFTPDVLVQFVNLKRGHTYAITSTASGVNPRTGQVETLSAADVALSTAHLAVPGPDANGATDQLLDTSIAGGLLTDSTGAPVDALPLQLRDQVFAGQGTAGIAVTSGTILDTDADVGATVAP